MGHDLKFWKEKEKKVSRLLEVDLRLYFQSFSTMQGREAYDIGYEKESKGDWHANPSCKQKGRKVSREVQGMIGSLTRNKRE